MRYGKLFLIALAVGSIALAVSASGAVPESRSVSSVALELDGAFVGYVDAPIATSDTGLLVDKTGLSKDIASLHATEITIQAGAAMGKPMYDWIKASFDKPLGTVGRKDGAIIYSDFNRKELSRLEFTNALLAEVDMPALDAASTSDAKMTLKIRPETSSRSFAHAGSVLSQGKQKTWHCSNFRLELGGLPLRTGALGCTQPPMLNPALDPPTTQRGSLVFDSHEIQAFVDWQQALYCSGLPQEANERACTFTYLDPDGATLFTSSFVSTGLFKLTPNTDATGAVVSYTAQLYMTGGVLRRFRANPLVFCVGPRLSRGWPVQERERAGLQVRPSSRFVKSLTGQYPPSALASLPPPVAPRFGFFTGLLRFTPLDNGDRLFLLTISEGGFIMLAKVTDRRFPRAILIICLLSLAFAGWAASPEAQSGKTPPR